MLIIGHYVMMVVHSAQPVVESLLVAGFCATEELVSDPELDRWFPLFLPAQAVLLTEAVMVMSATTNFVEMLFGGFLN